MNEHKNPNEPSSNDYLWDRSGSPDPEIQRLESLLAKFRCAESPLTLPADRPAVHATSVQAIAPSRPRTWKIGWLLPRFSAAAILLLALAATVVFTFRRATAPTTNIAWNVSSVQGAPQIGSQTLAANQAVAKLQVGQTLSTNSSSRATLFQTDSGQIQIDPNSQLRLLQSAPNRKHIQLDQGTIHAYIWAPPTQFVVDTPSAVAIDLGCSYTLHVEPDGSGTIRTSLGWVGFQLHGRDSFIPAGALCHTRPNVGPGTPYFEDASPAFQQALHNFDNAPQPDSVAADLEIILHQSRPKDALTLWHLLSRTADAQREKVYDRLTALVPPPAATTREAILQLDPRSLDLYWNALNLGDISIWRYYQQSSQPNNTSPPPIQLQKQILKQPAR